MQRGQLISQEKKTEGLKNESRDFPGAPVVENLPANAGGTGSIPGSLKEISPGCSLEGVMLKLKLHEGNTEGPGTASSEPLLPS